MFAFDLQSYLGLCIRFAKLFGYERWIGEAIWCLRWICMIDMHTCLRWICKAILVLALVLCWILHWLAKLFGCLRWEALSLWPRPGESVEGSDVFGCWRGKALIT